MKQVRTSLKLFIKHEFENIENMYKQLKKGSKYFENYIK